MRSLLHITTLLLFNLGAIHSQTTLQSLNDEFDNSESLQDWKLFHKEEGWPNHILKVDINTSTKSALHLEPQVGFWYGDVHSGPFLYKEISGNFTVVTKIKVEGRNSDVPEKLFSLAGLMVRNPRGTNVSKTKSKQENWVFLTTGFAEKKRKVPAGPQFETKVTIKSKSKLKIYPAPKGWLEIAISRVGDTFYLLTKNEENAWTCLRQVVIPNSKTTLQVGFIAYTDFNKKMKRRYIFNRKKLNTTVYKDGSPDVIARMEYFRVFRHSQKEPLQDLKDISRSLSLPQ